MAVIDLPATVCSDRKTLALRQPLTETECQILGQWRRAPEVARAQRTDPPTVRDQTRFYAEVVLNPDSRHYVYAITKDGQFVGVGTIKMDPAYRRREAEIGLILDPHARGKGLGSIAVDLLLEQAKTLGVTKLHGEVLGGSSAHRFWSRRLQRDGVGFTWTWPI